LNIQEFQSKILMERYGLNVQKFKVADTPAQAAAAAKELRT
jgi:succinyl-CoA synthetase beta subunit